MRKNKEPLAVGPCLSCKAEQRVYRLGAIWRCGCGSKLFAVRWNDVITITELKQEPDA